MYTRSGIKLKFHDNISAEVRNIKTKKLHITFQKDIGSCYLLLTHSLFSEEIFKMLIIGIQMLF